jgi:hypothetical protein
MGKEEEIMIDNLKDVALAVVVIATCFTLFVLIPFGAAWGLGRLLGAG